MATVVEMPRLSDTMIEGTVARWIRALGERVEAGEELAEIETDKAVMVFESFDDGVLLATLVPEGGTVPLGTPIAILGAPGEDIAEVKARALARIEAAVADAAAAPEAPAQAPAAVPTPTPAPAQAAVPAAARDLGGSDGAAAPPSAPGSQARATTDDLSADLSTDDLSAPRDDDGQRIRVSPLARRIALERGLDLRGVAGTGPHGRIVKRDVESAVPSRQVRGGSTAATRPDEAVRVTQMRKTIARRLVEAKQTAPHYYLQSTCDVGRLMALREDLNQAQSRLKVSYNDLVMRACVVALLDHPEVNAAWEGATIRRFGAVHLGFAVAMPEGLITPVVRHAERLDLFGLGEQIRELAARAKAMTLESEDYTGNSFCVSNLGMYGLDRFTAIINPPAACILAVGGISSVPVVRDGAVVPGHTMTLSLSCDHRVVDGAVGAAFLRDLKAVIERPVALLL